MKKVFIAILIFFLLIITVNPKLYAQQESNDNLIKPGRVDEALIHLSPIRFLPSDNLYFLIISKEAVERLFRANAVEKAEFDLAISGKRLKEVYLLTKQDDNESTNRQLVEYQKQLTQFLKQLEQAKQYNFDIRNISLKSADQLYHQQALLLALQEYQESENSRNKFGQVIVFLKSQSAEISDYIKGKFEGEY